MDYLQTELKELPSGETGTTKVLVGHATDEAARTGCSVVIFEEPATYNAIALGGGVSTRQVSALVPWHSVVWADAVAICGGSAYGLDAAGGVMKWLERRGRGTRVSKMLVPSVPSLAIFDLLVGDGKVRPDKTMGLLACEGARATQIEEGTVGAGSGATVGKVLGLEHASWGGVGLYGVKTGDGILVGGLAVVNAFGNVYAEGRCIAGARAEDGTFIDVEALIMAKGVNGRTLQGANTTIAVLWTSARLTFHECGRCAAIAALAISDCIRPSHTPVDGDMVVLASLGQQRADPLRIGLLGRYCLRNAIIRAVTEGHRPKRPPRDFLFEDEKG